MSKWIERLLSYFKTEEGKSLLLNITKTNFWSAFKELFTKSLVKILKLEALGGFKAWLVSFLIEHFYDDIVEPLLKLAVRRVKNAQVRIEGEILIKKLKQAEQDGNQTDYDATIDDILS